MTVAVSELVKKWENAKGKMSIKNISDRYLKENMAILLENQERKDWSGNLLTEASTGSVNTGTLGGFTNGVADSDSYKFRPVTLALVRRTLPELFANKVVGVQAMSTPVGLAYAMRVLYQDGTGNEAAWDSVPEYAGFTGSTVGTSAARAGSTPNTSAFTGIYDSSATGASATTAEAWTISARNNVSTTSGTLSWPTGYEQWPQLGMRIDQTAITAISRKLASTFSLEAAQDIKAMHGIEIEREMVNFLQYEIQAELDRELVYRMKAAATNTAANYGGATIAAIDCTGSGTGIDGRWSGEKYMNIVASIIHQANQIAIKTRRGAGNFVVVSPAIATALQAAGHQFVQYSSNVNATTTASAIGKLNGTIEVYRDQYATGNSEFALVGYKGPGISDSGIIFSPYIMGLQTRAINPYSFTPAIGAISRYAITDNLLGSGRYYRLIPYYNVNKMIPSA